MNPKPCNLTFAARSKGGTIAGQHKRADVAERLNGLTPAEIYRRGYQAGFRTGRIARKRAA